MSRGEHTDVCWWIRGLHAEIFALVSDLKKIKKRLKSCSLPGS